MAEIPKDLFLSQWGTYIDGIAQGQCVDESFLRPCLSSIFTSDPSLVYAQVLSNGKYLIKSRRPVIQLQRHHFVFSDTFHFGVMGEESITWGVSFSYPQLFLDPHTQQIGKVEKNEYFPNTELFTRLRRWVRDHTTPTPFIVEGERKNQPIRLGKNCFEWINNHPGLKGKNLHVRCKSHSQSTD